MARQPTPEQHDPVPGYEDIDSDSLDYLKLDQSSAAKVLQIWKLRCLRAARSHYSESTRLIIWNSVLTMINSLGAITIGMISAYSFARKEDDILGLVAFISAAIVLLTSIYQYLKKFEENSLLHKLAANEFANIQRKIERYLSGKIIKMGSLHNINRDINFVTKGHPIVSPRSWAKHSNIDIKIQQLECEVDARFWSGIQETHEHNGRH